MRPFYLSNRIPWFGAHTGYEQLPACVRAEGNSPRIFSSKENFLARAAGKAVSLLRGHGRISQSDAAARLRLELALRRNRDGVGHILYGEEHLPYWRDASPEAQRRTILTLHQPASQWKEDKIRSLAGLPRAIVLWRRELDWFREKLGGQGEIHFVPHGVDLDFFSPPPRPPAPLRLLYVGVHLRNRAMLGRLVEKLGGRDLEFDFLVPAHRRSDPGLVALAENRRVRWHGGLNDEQLRELYRAAHLLLLPLNNSGANTAVIEALACGLPVVTSDVGGIRDYGGGTVFPVVENNDDEGMLALIEKYLDQPGWRDEVGRRCRAFAETELAWPLAARRHVEIYRKALE
jgi:glycosyltransferase involved in cell wall biosynthesis